MSTGEILLIFIVYLLFFGAKGIPSLAQTLGKAVYQFRNATKDVQDEILRGANDIRNDVQNGIYHNSAAQTQETEVKDNSNTAHDAVKGKFGNTPS